MTEKIAIEKNYMKCYILQSLWMIVYEWIEGMRDAHLSPSADLTELCPKQPSSPSAALYSGKDKENKINFADHTKENPLDWSKELIPKQMFRMNVNNSLQCSLCGGHLKFLWYDCDPQ